MAIIRAIVCRIWHKSSRLRRRSDAFLVGLVVLAAMTSSYLLVTYTLFQWRPLAHDRRNHRLMSLVDLFPKQDGANLTEYQLNVRLSNRIPLDRDIPDTRPTGCEDLVYPEGSLDQVSVIIPFYNEAWSMLLRCLHSVIDRSPPRLIKEVLLVDDNSEYSYLKEPLTVYAAGLSAKIRIIRSGVRQGLIRARLLAARESTADVIVFLDAHVECNVGWLPPLLDVIRKNRKTIAVPHIDNILPDTIEYRAWSGFVYGGFQWNMDYIWKLVPNETLSRRLPADNYETPTTIGCALAIDRNYFFALGAYDEDMYVWGGENLDISFRIWMCGGWMLVVPCSRVGHVFRRWLPYSFPSKYGGRYIKYKNYQRVADVWMDEYSLYYYASVRGLVLYDARDVASLKRRRQLRKDLGCRDFRWYLDHVVRDYVEPRQGALFYGQFKVLGGNACLSGHSPDRVLLLNYCGLQSADQVFMYMNDSTIVHRHHCITATSQRDVRLETCSADNVNQRWRREEVKPNEVIFAINPEAKDSYRQYSINIKGFNFCLTHLQVKGMQVIGLMPCDCDIEVAVYQYWSFTLELDFSFAKRAHEERNKLF